MISTKTGFGSDTDITFKQRVKVGLWKSTIRSSLICGRHQITIPGHLRV